MTSPLEQAKKYLSHITPNQNDIIRGWFLGKAIQCLNVSSSSSSDPMYETIQKEFEKCQKTKQTSLSNNVFKFVVIQGHPVTFSLNDFLTSDYLLDWSKLTKSKLTHESNNTSEDELFQISGRYMQNVARVVHEHYFKNLTIDEFEQRYKKYFTLVQQKPEVFKIAFEYHKKNDSLFAFLMLVPFVERALQNMYFAYKMKHLPKKKIQQIEVPSKLKDLLVQKEMLEMFGEDLCFLLRLLIGPLHGLNLRNVTIHGFITREEWYPGYTSLLFLLILSLSPLVSTIKKKYELPDAVQQFTPVDSDLGYGTTEVFKNCKFEQKEIENVLSRSLFVIPTFKIEWMTAIQEFFVGKYYSSITRMFPLIEHSIRRIYVCVNHCEGRFFTAEQHSLYTTLDILLADILLFEDSSKKVNLIHEELGLVYQNAIFDWFIWDSSPRVRDIISHGACEPSSLSKHLAEKLLALGLALCVKYDVKNTGTIEYLNNLPEPLRQSVEYYAKIYEPLHHPKNVLFRHILDCEKELKKCKDFAIGITSESFPQIKEEQTINVTHVKILIQSLQEFIKKIDEISLGKELSAKRFFKVIRSEKDIKKTIKMSEILQCCIECMRKIQKSFLQLKPRIQQRKANVRERKQFVKLYHLSTAFITFFELVLKTIRYDYMSEDENPKFMNKCYNVVGSMAGSFKQSKWLYSYEIMIAFLFDNAELEKRFSKEFQYSLIKPQFAASMFGDLNKTYFKNK